MTRFDTELSTEKRTRRAAFLGFTVDMYDIYLPVVALAPAMVYFQPPGEISPSTVSTLYYLTFVATLLGRPIGAFIFGHLADTLGRRRTTLWSVFGFSIATLLIAVLPGYSQIGIWAMVLLIALRLIDGIFLGGQYTAATPLAMESSPKHKRGFNGAFITGGYAIASAAVAIITFFVLQFTDSGTAESTYSTWGWRIPFLIGAAASIVLYFYLQKMLPESKAWEEAVAHEPQEHRKSVVRELFTGSHRKQFRQVFILMTGVWIVFLSVASTLPDALSSIGVDSSTYTAILTGTNVVLFLAYLLFGVLGQRLGRKRTFIVGGLLNILLTVPMYIALVVLNHQSVLLTFVLTTFVSCLAIAGVLGIPMAYLTERFPTEIRASGYGIGWSLSLVIPSFYSFAMLGIARYIPYEYSQIVLIPIGAIIMIIGALMGPETNHVDLAEARMGAGEAGDRKVGDYRAN